MLIFTPKAWHQIQLAVHHDTSKEVSGFGRTVLDPERDSIVVTDIFIPPQEIGGAHTDISGDQLTTWGEQLFAERKELLADWRLWWHSHQKMGVNPSGQDTITLRMLAQLFNGWAVGMVVNDRLESHIWVDVSVPTNVTYQMKHELDIAASPEWEDEVKTMMLNVKPKPYPHYFGPSSYPKAPMQGTNSHPTGGEESSKKAAYESFSVWAAKFPKDIGKPVKDMGKAAAKALRELVTDGIFVIIEDDGRPIHGTPDMRSAVEGKGRAAGKGGSFDASTGLITVSDNGEQVELLSKEDLADIAQSGLELPIWTHDRLHQFGQHITTCAHCLKEANLMKQGSRGWSRVVKERRLRRESSGKLLP